MSEMRSEAEPLNAPAGPEDRREGWLAAGGVSGAWIGAVAVDFAAKTATVTFDPSVTTPEAIAAASADAGYPAWPAG